jgi:drug/metabolite transporter (DMT)-like permease
MVFAVFSQAIYSAIFQSAILGVPLHPLSLLGCAVILAAAAWVMISPK